MTSERIIYTFLYIFCILIRINIVIVLSNLFSSCRIMNSVDNVLHLSQIFGLQASEPGVIVVEFIFSTVCQLVDASLDDEGLLELTPEKKSKWVTKSQDMEVASDDNYDEKRIEHQERLQNLNTVMAVELIGQFLQNKVTSRILYLARQNMSELHSFSNCFSVFVRSSFKCVI